jgi:hypothetical protein
MLLAPLAAATAIGAVAALPAGAHEGDGLPLVDQTSEEMPCLSIDLRQDRETNPECADLPHFKASFLNRVWRFKAAVDGFQNTEDHVLSVTVDQIEGLPRRFRSQDEELVDQDAYVLLSGFVRVYDPNGRLVPHDELEHAEYVRVNARVLRPRRWRVNEDEDVVPTLRAKRVYVTEWVTGYRGDEGCDIEQPDETEVPDEAQARYAECG